MATFPRWMLTAVLGFIVLGWRVAPDVSANGRGSGGFEHRRNHGEPRPPIGHVFVIVLENEGFDTTFSPQSKAPYLSKTLTRAGVLLTQYYGTGHASLENYIAMISGQAATPETRNDCQTFQNIRCSRALKTSSTPTTISATLANPVCSAFSAR
jgi:hypothetical protein